MIRNAERTLTPNPSPCAQGEGLSAVYGAALGRYLPSESAQGEGEPLWWAIFPRLDVVRVRNQPLVQQEVIEGIYQNECKTLCQMQDE
jgi:hypothetical protein